MVENSIPFEKRNLKQNIIANMGNGRHSHDHPGHRQSRVGRIADIWSKKWVMVLGESLQ